MSVNQRIKTDILPVIDSHAHIFPDEIADKAKEGVSEFYDLPMYTSGKLSELYKVRDEVFGNKKITTQVIFSPAMTSSQTKSINNFISDICKGDESLIGFGTLHKDNDDYKDEIQRIKSLGLKGVKFHSDFQKTNIDDEKMIPIYREIANEGLPVVFHMGDKNLEYSSVDKLKNVLNDIPNLTVIAAHMGGYMHWKEAYNTLEADSRLYFDISSALSFISREDFIEMLEKFGINQFFFGSDFPMWNPIDELRKLSEFVTDEADRRKIEYYNYVDLIKKHIQRNII